MCGLVLTGCDRSEKEDTTEAAEVTEQDSVDTEDTAATAVSCDDPMVQDRLKAALRNTLNQQAQSLAANYANEAEIDLSSGSISEKTNGVVIDVQNAAVLQDANNNGMTTCQASVSMTLPSEDLYQASQVQAANNQPSLQSRLAQNNIRINNNMLVDDAFTYVVGMQGGQVRTRIAGQPALIAVVADVVAASVFQSAMDEERAERAAERRESAQNNDSGSAPVRQPRVTNPAEPTRPATPPTVNNNQSSSNEGNGATANPTPPAVPKVVPNDESIDMVIIEDESATY